MPRILAASLLFPFACCITLRMYARSMAASVRASAGAASGARLSGIRENCGGKSIVIEGHAFELPTTEMNKLLSQLRVTLVVHELEKRGVPGRQLLPVPLGDTQPIGSRSAPDFVAESRRITFRVVQ